MALARWPGMPRVLRSLLPDGIYHVTANAVAEGVLFRDDGDRVVYLRLLGAAARRYRWTSTSSA